MSNQGVFLKDIIASKDYRQFLENNTMKLSDWDKATIIYNHKIATYEEKNNVLINIMNGTNDKLLKQQIDERLLRDKRYLEMFKVNAGNALYSLCTWYEGKYDIDGYYMDFISAYEAGLNEGVKFIIKKDLFECKRKIDDKSGVFGGVEFDDKGKVNNLIWLYSLVEEDVIEKYNIERFEYRSIDLPLLFRQKDIVHIIGTNLYGIVDAPIDDEDEKESIELAKTGDYSDWQVPVNLMYDGNKFQSVFSHEHVAPSNLEYAELDENDPRKSMMEYMITTLYDGSWFSGKGRNKSRIPTIISALETVWKQYPDLRLGQLIINVCGNKDLFAIEDEILLERLQYNTFRIKD